MKGWYRTVVVKCVEGHWGVVSTVPINVWTSVMPDHVLHAQGPSHLIVLVAKKIGG